MACARANSDGCQMILVSGAAGKTGLAVIRALTQRKRKVRALVLRTDQGERAHISGALEVIVGDMREEDSWQKASEGVQAIYHICPNVSPFEVEIGTLAIQAGQLHHVERFVFHSVLHPQIREMNHHWLKLEVEERLFESGLSWTILQPTTYMQNVFAGLQEITRTGFYSVPYPVETRLGMVDLDDVAQVAALVLTETGHEAAMYELAGSEILTQLDVARILTKYLSRSVTAKQENVKDWRIRTQALGLSNYQIETLLAMFEYYARYGFWGNPTILTHLLGREPTKFEEFVQKSLPRGEK
jgi:uncharacterized protein YbjT (DUF2867 family)